MKPDTKGYMLYNSIYMKCLEYANLYREKILVVVRANRKQEWRVTANRYGASFGDDENVQRLYCGDSCTTLLIYERSLNCTLYKSEFYGT